MGSRADFIMDDSSFIVTMIVVFGGAIFLGAFFLLSIKPLNESINDATEVISQLESSTQVEEELIAPEETYTTVSQVEEKTDDAGIKISEQNNRNQVNVERYNYLKNKVTLPSNIYLSNLNKVFTKLTNNKDELKYANLEMKSTFYIQKDIGSVFYIFDDFEFEGLTAPTLTYIEPEDTWYCLIDEKTFKPIEEVPDYFWHIGFDELVETFISNDDFAKSYTNKGPIFVKELSSYIAYDENLKMYIDDLSGDKFYIDNVLRNLVYVFKDDSLNHYVFVNDVWYNVDSHYNLTEKTPETSNVWHIDINSFIKTLGTSVSNANGVNIENFEKACQNIYGKSSIYVKDIKRYCPLEDGRYFDKETNCEFWIKYGTLSVMYKFKDFKYNGTTPTVTYIESNGAWLIVLDNGKYKQIKDVPEYFWHIDTNDFVNQLIN